MKRIIFLACSLFCMIVNAQNFNLKILNLPENPTVEDFSFLKEELKGVQVVMLGENTHQDGNVFEMKTKIVKYLNQEMGFNTIAFESGVYDVWKAQENINKGDNTKEALKSSLFRIWSNVKEFQSFIEFYDKNKAYLKLFGFDNQITGKYGEENLVKDLYKYCDKNQLSLTLNREDLELLMESISSGVFDEGDISYNQYKKALTQLLNSINGKSKLDEQFYWTQIIKNLLSLGEGTYLNIKNPDSFCTGLRDNIRDKQMADNLLTYVKNHPNEKIICWGASGHFVNDMSSINTPVLKEFVPMGSYIKSALKDKVYSLAAVTAADSIYLQGKWEKTPVSPESFEYYLKSKKSPHSFISSRQEEMRKKQLNRFFSPITFVEARLDLLHDGYLFFDTVTQSTAIESDENEVKKAVEGGLDSASTTDDSENKITNGQKATKSKEKINALDEVLVFNKKTPYKILKKTIGNIKKNYPVDPFNSQLSSKVEVKVQDTTCLDFDFISNQYDRGYTQMYRSSKQLKEVRWNVKNGYEPKSLRREFYSYFNQNAVMRGQFLSNRKYKKFNFILKGKEIYNNKEVYVIDFTTDRDHFSYTQQHYKSHYSGTVYVNLEDYAVVKIIENWEFEKYPEDANQEFELLGWTKKYSKKEVTREIRESYYDKIDNLYFLSRSENHLIGNLFDMGDSPHPFQMDIHSFWGGINTAKPEPIPFKDEQNLFDEVNYNKMFWEAFKFPERF
jgi:erythromycin esterase-like protein